MSRSRGVRRASRSAAVLRHSSKLSRIPDALERASDARQKLLGANGFLQKIGGSGLHRLDRHRDVAMTGDHNRRQATVLGLQPLQESDSTHAWHQGIGHKASFPIRPVDREKRLAAGIGLGQIAVFVKQFLHVVAQGCGRRRRRKRWAAGRLLPIDPPVARSHLTSAAASRRESPGSVASAFPVRLAC